MAGTITATFKDYSSERINMKLIKFACVADAASSPYGDFPTGQDTTTLGISLDKIKGWSVVLVVTDPGAVASPPTDDYDIVINDDYGCDVMGGELTNRDTAITEQAMPKIGSHYGPRLVETALTPVITNNTVAGATIDIYVYLQKV